MAPNTRNRFHARWWWLLGLIPLMSLAMGCTPGSLAMILMPFVDDRIPPRHKLAKKGEEVTVVVYANFVRGEVPLTLEPAAGEMADLVTAHLKKRVAANKEKVTLISPGRVRSYMNQNLGQALTAREIGEHFKADYVISLEIRELSLHPRNSPKTLFLGNAEVDVALTDMAAEDGDARVFNDIYRTSYPRSGPIDAGGANPVQFRSQFMNKMARDLSRWFTAFPKEERLDIE